MVKDLSNVLLIFHFSKTDMNDESYYKEKNGRLSYG